MKTRKSYTRNSKVPVIITTIAFSGLLLFPGCSGNGTVNNPTTGNTATVSPPETTPAFTTVPPGTIPITTQAPALTSKPPQIATPASLVSQSALLKNTQYVVFAWNDLGMHCLNPTYDEAVVLPPYNNIFAQVVKRGNPPQVVTQGFTIEYRIVGNTTSANKNSFGQFWDNAQKLFGTTVERNKGLNLVDPAISNGLTGKMVTKGNHFEVDGIPLTPILDNGDWTPFQIAEITVKNAAGSIVASTFTTAPTSEELNCAKCHGSNAFANIMSTHDKNEGTKLASDKPVLCASCHGSPALGAETGGTAGYLSAAIHNKHSTLATQPACYDCHPGPQTKCNRSLAHTTADGNCTACHGSLANVGSSITGGRVPWVTEPACVQCHKTTAQVDTGSILYRNAQGHGGLYCASCHSSPHAQKPTSILSDNFQSLQYQGSSKAIGACESCHNSSRGAGSLREFAEVHGGANPERFNACYICHTAVTTTDTTKWPHQFQWAQRSK